MKDTSKITVTKPLAWYNRVVKVDFKKIFISLSKTIIVGKLKGPFAPMDGLKELMDVFNAFELEGDTSGALYNLLLKSMVNAAHNLAKENSQYLGDEINNEEELYDNDEYVKFLDGINELLDNNEISVGVEDIKNPQQFKLLPDFQKYFKLWMGILGMNENVATVISKRLPSYFTFSVNDEWKSNVKLYESIYLKLNTPITEAVRREISWERYFSYLKQIADQSVFGEPYSLKQIYIPLRAKFITTKSVINESYIHSTNLDLKYKKVKVGVPVYLDSELDKWIDTNNQFDCIRFLSGGPGSGKSSFVKIWVNGLLERNRIKVVIVPLHLFDLSGDLQSAIGNFVQSYQEIGFDFNPLLNVKEKILIVFDGLDELSQQGSYAIEVSRRFVRDVSNYSAYVNRENEIKVLFFITGREVSIQNNTDLFRSERQVIHLMPYHEINNSDRIHLEKAELDLIEIDQRDEWWKRYGEIIGDRFDGIPLQFKAEKLDEVTAQPLLNFLVALSYRRNKIEVNSNTNLNDIYKDLIEGVYERAYESHGLYKPLSGLTLEHFKRMLEEVALSAWHGGDVRTTSISKITQRLTNVQLINLLGRFQADASSGIMSLLTAFYFRQHDFNDGDPTFEFTHKSFGEYFIMLPKNWTVEISKIH